MQNITKMEEDIVVYSSGLCYLSACIKKGLNIDDVIDEINTTHPTGIESKWQKTDESFHDGNKNPCECDRYDNREHILLVC